MPLLYAFEFVPSEDMTQGLWSLCHVRPQSSLSVNYEPLTGPCICQHLALILPHYITVGIHMRLKAA